MLERKKEEKSNKKIVMAMQPHVPEQSSMQDLTTAYFYLIYSLCLSVIMLSYPTDDLHPCISSFRSLFFRWRSRSSRKDIFIRTWPEK